MLCTNATDYLWHCKMNIHIYNLLLKHFITHDNPTTLSIIQYCFKVVIPMCTFNTNSLHISCLILQLYTSSGAFGVPLQGFLLKKNFGALDLPACLHFRTILGQQWLSVIPKSVAFYCTIHPTFIMPFVVTLTAVNTEESFYAQDQCKSFSCIINHGQNLL